MDLTHYAFLAAALLACLLWLMEMRTVQSLRDGHREECARLRKEFSDQMAFDLQSERAIGWNEGREYQISITKQKRDAKGRYAREESKT